MCLTLSMRSVKVPGENGGTFVLMLKRMADPADEVEKLVEAVHCLTEGKVDPYAEREASSLVFVQTQLCASLQLRWTEL